MRYLGPLGDSEARAEAARIEGTRKQSMTTIKPFKKLLLLALAFLLKLEQREGWSD